MLRQPPTNLLLVVATLITKMLGVVFWEAYQNHQILITIIQTIVGIVVIIVVVIIVVVIIATEIIVTTHLQTGNDVNLSI